MANNRVVHFKIPANEPEALTKFYGGLFGWTFQKAPIPGVVAVAAIMDPQGKICGLWEREGE